MSSAYTPNRVAILFVEGLVRLPLPLLALLGTIVGQLAYWLDWRRRRIVRRNLAACFPQRTPAQRRRLARRHFRALARSTFCSVAISWWRTERRLQRCVRLRNEHYFNDARRDAPAVILMVPHFVGLELAWLRTAYEHKTLGLTMVGMYREPRKHLFHWAAHRYRGRFGGVPVERSGGLRPLIRHMREGKTFFYLPDVDLGKHTPHVFAPFFGTPAATVTALSRIARMTDAVVIPCVPRERAWGRYEIEFYPPMPAFDGADDIADATRMNAFIEVAVRDVPVQYLWVHRRFKTRPSGEPSFYA